VCRVFVPVVVPPDFRRTSTIAIFASKCPRFFAPDDLLLRHSCNLTNIPQRRPIGDASRTATHARACRTGFTTTGAATRSATSSRSHDTNFAWHSAASSALVSTLSTRRGWLRNRTVYGTPSFSSCDCTSRLRLRAVEREGNDVGVRRSTNRASSGPVQKPCAPATAAPSHAAPLLSDTRARLGPPSMTHV